MQTLSALRKKLLISIYMNRIIPLFLIPFLFFVSCKSLKTPATTIKSKKPGFLNAKIKENEIQFETLSAKAKIVVRDKTSHNSFHTHCRIKKDSLIWISVSPALGIEVGRMIITPDSVKLFDRVHRKYVVTDLSFIRNKYDLPVEFDVIQKLMIGNIFNYDEERAEAQIDSNLYQLKSDNGNELVTIWLNPEEFSINMMDILDKDGDQRIFVKFDDYKRIESKLFSYRREIKFNSEEAVTARIQYTHVKFDEKLSYPFSIPAKYEKLQ